MTPNHARYRTIVVDPPWDHEDGTGVDTTTGNVTSIPYRSMTVKQIAELPVRDISDNLNGDAFLYLWTTSRYLREAFDIARGWGFHYSATLVWCKASRGFSIDYSVACDGPDCPRTVVAGHLPPPCFLTVVERDGADRHFCGWDCVLRYASNIEPEEVISDA